MEAQQAVVMQVEANLEEEKVKSEEYLAIVRKYKERQDEMEVSVDVWIILVKHWNFYFQKILLKKITLRTNPYKLFHFWLSFWNIFYFDQYFSEYSASMVLPKCSSFFFKGS